MATKTTKKTTARKGTVKTTRKTPAKRSTKASSNVSYRSFRLARSDQAFMSFRISTQTVYWTLLVAVIIFLQLWIIRAEYDAVAANNSLIQATQNTVQTTNK